MGKVEDMRRQREALHGGSAVDEPAPDATEGRCSGCRKRKALKDGLLVSHQKGLGSMCPGSRKPPL